MRVVLVLKTRDGGLWTVPHVEELLRRGHQVVAVLPPGGGRLPSALAGLGVTVLDSAFDFRFRARIGTVRNLLKLRRQLIALRPDVVYYHLYASALAVRLSTVGTGIARVHMVAGPLYLESVAIRCVERVLMRLDHVTIGGSRHTSERYRALGLPPSRTPAIPYGVDTTRFSPPDQALRARRRMALDVPDDVFLAIMVAYAYAPKRLVHAGRGIKGHDVLLTAWQSFRRAYPRSRLLLVGAGFDAAGEAYRQQIVARFHLDRDPSVTWLPTVADIRAYYEAADVSVSPSLSENHGAALEATAMGLPCIVSRAGGLPETVDADTGWDIPVDDVPALIGALTAARREFESGRLGDRGERARRRTVLRFDQRDCARAVADVIERSVS